MRSVFELDVVDRVHAYLAPMLLGGGRGLLDGPLAGTLADAHRFELYDAFSLGDDAVVELRRPRPHDKESD